MKARTSQLSSDNLDAVLKASKNGLRKGQQSYWTPLPYAELLMLPLTRTRAAIADLQCGAGNLLKAATTAETKAVMGTDIDPRCVVPVGIHGDCRKHRGVGSCVEMFDILNEAQVKLDLSLWNPPFSLRWQVDSYGKTPTDSTLASFRMAGDLMSPWGEALFICNAATADRLLADAPGIEKCWLWLTMPSFFEGVDPTMQVAVLYLANDHATGPYRHAFADHDPANLRPALLEFHNQRGNYISGRTNNYPTSASYTIGDQFRACAEELERREKERAGKGGGFNIWLSDEGKIRTYLTSFQQKSTKVPRDLAERLATLDQRHPMELAVQSSTRNALLQAVDGGTWRVHPDAVAEVHRCVFEYNAHRRPFVPLNAVNRLGFLDEEDSILCLADFAGCVAHTKHALSTRSVTAKKTEIRKRYGMPDERVLVTGQTLVIDIENSHGEAVSFVANPECHEGSLFHPLEDLLAHFEIPEVLDIASANPTVFEDYKKRLLALERP